MQRPAGEKHDQLASAHLHQGQTDGSLYKVWLIATAAGTRIQQGLCRNEREYTLHHRGGAHLPWLNQREAGQQDNQY